MMERNIDEMEGRRPRRTRSWCALTRKDEQSCVDRLFSEMDRFSLETS